MKTFVKTLIVIVVLICIAIGGFFYSAYKFWNPSWTTEAKLKGPDGYTYYFMDYSMLQAQIMKLVRKKGSISEELGSNNGDSPRSWASIVRLAGVPDDNYGQLYISPQNVVLGIRYDNHCYLAYDIDNGVFYGHGQIEEISPFMLIEKDTQLHEPDVFALLQEVVQNSDFHQKHYGGVTGFLPGCPRKAVLVKGLEHPNEEIRKISKWLLEIQNEGLASSTDTIREILDYISVGLTSENKIILLNAIKTSGYFQNHYTEKFIPVLEEIVCKKEKDIPSVSSEAAISLGRLGEAAFPVLMKLLKSEDSSLRFYGLLGFRFAGSKAKVYEQDIKSLLNDRNSNVRRQAKHALENINNPRY